MTYFDVPLSSQHGAPASLSVTALIFALIPRRTGVSLALLILLQLRSTRTTTGTSILVVTVESLCYSVELMGPTVTGNFITHPGQECDVLLSVVPRCLECLTASRRMAASVYYPFDGKSLASDPGAPSYRRGLQLSPDFTRDGFSNSVYVLGQRHYDGAVIRLPPGALIKLR